MSAEPIVVLDRAAKRYGGDGRTQTVLDGLSLDVRAGEMVSIVGPSGCGKTTLLNIIGALDRPDAGRVRCCGVDLTAADRGALTAYRARSVGFVFQFYNLLPTLTALENVEAGLIVAGVGRAEAKKRGRRMLARVGLEDEAGKFPAELSGGEQQRVAIARALGKQPALVLADEPTGNLDQGTGAGDGVDACVERRDPDHLRGGHAQPHRRIGGRPHGAAGARPCRCGGAGMILLRKALRDVRAMGARAVLLVLVIGAGIGMAAGIGLALRDVRATRDASTATRRSPTSTSASNSRSRPTSWQRGLKPPERRWPRLGWSWTVPHRAEPSGPPRRSSACVRTSRGGRRGAGSWPWRPGSR